MSCQVHPRQGRCGRSAVHPFAAPRLQARGRLRRGEVPQVQPGIISLYLSYYLNLTTNYLIYLWPRLGSRSLTTCSLPTWSPPHSTSSSSTTSWTSTAPDRDMISGEHKLQQNPLFKDVFFTFTHIWHWKGRVGVHATPILFNNNTLLKATLNSNKPNAICICTI